MFRCVNKKIIGEHFFKMFRVLAVAKLEQRFYPVRMKTRESVETGWRGSREGWLEAGYGALIDSGVDGVKIQILAKQLGLSRTSFYWFFHDREELLDALLEYWEKRTTQPLISSATQYAETLAEAMLNVLSCFLSDSFDSRLEFAVRSWALQNTEVATLIENADAARLAALHAMLVQWGHVPAEADVRARTIYLVQIGYISMQARETIETRLLRIPTYVQIYTGATPTKGELARFRATVL